MSSSNLHRPLAENHGRKLGYLSKWTARHLVNVAISFCNAQKDVWLPSARIVCSSPPFEYQTFLSRYSSDKPVPVALSIRFRRAEGHELPSRDELLEHAKRIFTLHLAGPDNIENMKQAGLPVPATDLHATREGRGRDGAITVSLPFIHAPRATEGIRSISLAAASQRINHIERRAGKAIDLKETMTTRLLKHTLTSSLLKHTKVLIVGTLATTLATLVAAALVIAVMLVPYTAASLAAVTAGGAFLARETIGELFRISRNPEPASTIERGELQTNSIAKGLKKIFRLEVIGAAALTIIGGIWADHDRNRNNGKDMEALKKKGSELWQDGMRALDNLLDMGAEAVGNTLQPKFVEKAKAESASPSNGVSNGKVSQAFPPAKSLGGN